MLIVCTSTCTPLLPGRDSERDARGGLRPLVLPSTRLCGVSLHRLCTSWACTPLPVLSLKTPHSTKCLFLLPAGPGGGQWEHFGKGKESTACSGGNCKIKIRRDANSPLVILDDPRSKMSPRGDGDLGEGYKAISCEAIINKFLKIHHYFKVFFREQGSFPAGDTSGRNIDAEKWAFQGHWSGTLQQSPT